MVESVVAFSSSSAEATIFASTLSASPSSVFSTMGSAYGTISATSVVVATSTPTVAPTATPTTTAPTAPASMSHHLTSIGSLRRQLLSSERRLSSLQTHDEFFDLADSALPSISTDIEQNTSFVVHTTYTGSTSNSQMTPCLVMLILCPPDQRLPEPEIADRGGVPIMGDGSSLRHLCGINLGHFGSIRGMKVIKLFEDHNLTRKIVPPELREIHENEPVPNLGEFGAHGAQTSFVQQKADKYMVMLGPRITELHPGVYCKLVLQGAFL